PMSTAVRAKGLVKTFGQARALDGLNLSGAAGAGGRATRRHDGPAHRPASRAAILLRDGCPRG
ncbi:hypothetical protein AB0K48_59280, partial [Nonomuraea sp. NPDC055795]